jgi:hypothetical protein
MGGYGDAGFRAFGVTPGGAKMAERTQLAARVNSIYSQTAMHILPFVGSCFENPDQRALRVLTIGINAYIGSKDLGKVSPDWFRRGFAEGKYRFDRGVFREAQSLASAVTGPRMLFEGLQFRDHDSIYHTNAIKVYLLEAEGKRVAQLTENHFKDFVKPWHAELAELAAHGALPHIAIVFGEPFWEIAWSTFHKEGNYRHPGLDVRRYESTSGSTLHHLNRITLGTGTGEHRMLLVRLAHPAARTRSRSARWLAQQPEFLRFGGAAL